MNIKNSVKMGFFTAVLFGKLDSAINPLFLSSGYDECEKCKERAAASNPFISKTLIKDEDKCSKEVKLNSLRSAIKEAEVKKIEGASTLKFSPIEFYRENILAVGYSNGNVELLNSISMTCIKGFRLSDNPAPVKSLSFSADGRFLVVGEGKAVYLLDLYTMEYIKKFECKGDVLACSIILQEDAVDKNILIYMDNLGNVITWDLSSMKGPYVFDCMKLINQKMQKEARYRDMRFFPEKPLKSAAISPDGENLAVGGSFRYYLIDIVKKECADWFQFRSTNGVEGMVYDQFGKFIAFASPDKETQAYLLSVGILDCESPLFRVGILECESPIKSLAFDATGEFLAAGCAEGCVILWDTNSKEKIKTIKLQEGEVAHAIAISPNNTMIVIGN